MTTLHGIKNCDTVRKARRWLDQHGIDYTFRDLRENIPTPAEIRSWQEQCDWQTLLNKRSTTWKGLSEAQRASATDAASAAELLATNPTLIKRPVLLTETALLVGFKPEQYHSLFAQHS